MTLVVGMAFGIIIFFFGAVVGYILAVRDMKPFEPEE